MKFFRSGVKSLAVKKQVFQQVGLQGLFGDLGKIFCRNDLIRIDSAHDAATTLDLLRCTDKVSYIVKWNPRQEKTDELCRRAFAEGRVTERTIDQ